MDLRAFAHWSRENLKWANNANWLFDDEGIQNDCKLLDAIERAGKNFKGDFERLNTKLIVTRDVVIKESEILKSSVVVTTPVNISTVVDDSNKENSSLTVEKDLEHIVLKDPKTMLEKHMAKIKEGISLVLSHFEMIQSFLACCEEKNKWLEGKQAFILKITKLISDKKVTVVDPAALNVKLQKIHACFEFITHSREWLQNQSNILQLNEEFLREMLLWMESRLQNSETTSADIFWREIVSVWSKKVLMDKRVDSYFLSWLTMNQEWLSKKGKAWSLESGEYVKSNDELVRALSVDYSSAVFMQFVEMKARYEAMMRGIESLSQKIIESPIKI